MQIDHKLESLGASLAGAQLAQTVLRIQARYDLSDGDTIALMTVAFTGILQPKIGEAATVEYLRSHADELERGLIERMLPAAISKRRH